MGNTQAARDLRAAANYIEKHGWTKYSLEDAGGGVCLIGALGQVINGRVGYEVCHHPRFLSVAAVMAPTVSRAMDKYSPGHYFEGLDAFNDVHCATPEDVTGALRKVANEIDPPAPIKTAGWIKESMAPQMPEAGLSGPGKEIFVEPRETPAPNVTPLPQKAPVAPVPEKVPA